MTKLSGLQDLVIRGIIALGFFASGNIETVDIQSWACYVGLFLSAWLLLFVYGMPRRRDH